MSTIFHLDKQLNMWDTNREQVSERKEYKNMTGKERISRILRHEPVDRIGLFEHFWNDTHKAWAKKGHIREDECMADHFGYDLETCWAFDTTADLDFKEQVVEETEDTIVEKNGNYATLRYHKKHDTTPEHVDFDIKVAKDYYERIRPLLLPEERRIDMERYTEIKERAAKAERFFCLSGVNSFECMHPVCGHEHMLVGMALEPEWIAEMAMDYAKLMVELQKMLFKKCGKPDGIWFYEDMGFKERPFMSPQMYRELIFPAHKYTIDFAKSEGLPVIMHSCGFIEPLLPDMIEAGIDCLQVIEVKAGMDLLKIHKEFGDKIALMGGIDVRALYSNDKAIIDAELEAKIPTVKNGYGFVLHSDHSIPETVDYETYRYFIKKGLELGTY